ncbi:PfkB family carbohydrate kinase [Haloarcula marismortui]|uniref:2-keto-3-deoxygluconate kinase n=1 Tax=Haloarcula marismortui ATCC 33800 TaxID=662476 RepID=M0K3M7_9EURY|nr:PfkB family carbohydrate kinase [Haloarcula sinaiiensis]EMA14734.1 2-keto-3-deoxygluconate kinase [Haloarcula sinaiiensis ATCC 33800]QUJ71859.1 sugar kinase [Haloarcula sinaiiensis ATCC 33800]
MSLVTFGETALRFSPPDGQRFETAREASIRVDGTASSVAATAGRLGADAQWLSKVPDTPLGRRVVAELHEFCLETEVVWADPDTGRQGLTFHEDADPPRAERLLQDRGDTAMATLTPGELPMGEIQNADVVFTSGATLSLSETAADTTGALLRAAAGMRAFDLGFHPGLWDAEDALDALADLLPAVDTLFAAEEQVSAVFDTTGSPREVVHTLATEYDLTRVILTRSEYGAVAYHDGVIHEQDAIETSAVDEAGQHEAFIGATLQQLAAGADTDEALLHGVAAAALSRTLTGPLTPLEPSEVERLVDSQQSRRP